MADIATVRRRRRERFGGEQAAGDNDNAAVHQVEQAPSDDTDNEEECRAMLVMALQGQTEGHEQQTVIPSEFECILCLR